MASDLAGLIKLRRHTVEEKQRALAELYRQTETIETSRQTLLNRRHSERALLEQSGTLEMYAYFGRFSQNIHRMVERLALEKEKLETRIHIAQDDMREAFAALKRIEIVQANRKEEEKRAEQEKETRELDEIGIEGYRRREE